MADKVTQNKMILAHLMAGGTITGLDALNMFGCMRLPARISDLKRCDVKISSKYVHVGDEKKVVKVYWIAEEDRDGALH